VEKLVIKSTYIGAQRVKQQINGMDKNEIQENIVRKSVAWVKGTNSGKYL